MNLKQSLLVALIVAAVPALYAADAKVKQITWNFDNLNKIGGLPVKDTSKFARTRVLA